MVHAPTLIDDNIGSQLKVTSCSKEKGKPRALDSMILWLYMLTNLKCNGFYRVDVEADKRRMSS